MVIFQIVIKAIIYPLLFGIAGARFGASAQRGMAAGFTRLVLGAVVGFPAGLVLFDGNPGPLQYTVFFAIRFALWFGVAALFLPQAKLPGWLALAALGTLLNAGLDFLLFQKPIGEAYNIRFC